MVKIVQVKTKRQLKEFVKFPYKLYKDEPNWIPPIIADEYATLDREKNPAFEYCKARYFLAYKDGKLVGRIAGIINQKYIDKWKNKYARFGWVDFIDDLEVAKALFGAVEQYAKENKLEYVHGPLGFCDLDDEGMLIKGFDEKSMFITIYNYPYYPKYTELAGYKKDVDWIEYLIDVPKEIPEKIKKLNRIILKKTKVKVIKFNKRKELLPYANDIFILLNKAYKDLYGVVELTEKQIEKYIEQYFGFINPDYVRVILDQNDEFAAFGIAMPSIADASKNSNGRIFPFGFIRYLWALKHSQVLELLLVAVRKDMQGKGLNALLLNEINESAIENGIKCAETGPELETNSNVLGLWKHYKTTQHKTRRCYIKKV